MSIIKEENLAKVVPVIETYVNGLSWYRIYADGWCEQDGIYNQSIGADTYPRIMLLHPFKDTNYTCFNNFIQTAVTGSWGSGAASISRRWTHKYCGLLLVCLWIHKYRRINYEL